MDRKTDVLKYNPKPNEGVNPFDNPQLKPGAKDSISGENVIQPFAPSASAKDAVKGKLGGEKAS